MKIICSNPQCYGNPLFDVSTSFTVEEDGTPCSPGDAIHWAVTNGQATCCHCGWMVGLEEDLPAYPWQAALGYARYLFTGLALRPKFTPEPFRLTEAQQAECMEDFAETMEKRRQAGDDEAGEAWANRD